MSLLESLKYLYPNAILAVGSLVVLMLGLWFRSSELLLVVSTAFVLGSTLLTAYISSAQSTMYFDGLVFHDAFSVFFSALFPIIIIYALLMGHYSKEILSDRKSEYFALILGLATGLLFMTSSNHFLMIYLGVETVSILSYCLAGFHREKNDSVEASMKYVVYGALASGVMIFGMSLVYAVSGELSITALRNFVHSVPVAELPVLFWIGVAFCFAGFGYKISAAPMHMWTPDVYEGSPTPVAAIFSVAPKAAGFALLLRFFVIGLSVPVSNSESVLSSGLSLVQTSYQAMGWEKFLALSAIFTMFMGNLAAIGQSSVKRILAYSSIAHAGYMLLGLTTQNTQGLVAILFYIVVYCTMNLGAFWIASLVEDSYGGDTLLHFRGLSKKSPWMAIMMAIFLFSLVGLPPFAGFIGKLYLFLAVLGQKMYGLAIIAAVNSVISLYYYAKILKAMFLEKTTETLPVRSMPIPKVILFFLALLVIPNILFGLYWEPVVSWAQYSLSFAR